MPSAATPAAVVVTVVAEPYALTSLLAA